MKIDILKNRKGFTLVEVVAATTIMAIAFVALLSLFTMSSGAVNDTKKRTDMMMVARDLMEYSCKNSTQGFSVLSGLSTGVPQSIDSLINSAYSSKYNAQRTISTVTTNKLIKVIIQVKEKSMVSYNSGVLLVTLLSNEP